MFAGLWEFNRLLGEDILLAAIIVGEPNPLVSGVHDRMPVMLLPEDYDAWLGPTSSPEVLRGLLRPYDESLMEAYAVSRAVNSVKNDTEECIEPLVSRLNLTSERDRSLSRAEGIAYPSDPRGSA